ncbi:hypothetical protein TWF106_011385 [Orbilia oligospora]|uniref:F-box domain-containing protein n=1 Tax=Orbilia oligospora TaxID=2813651 RepID=A0A6G1M2U6_ORBOL|nr:hypothetical protein TWF191_003183 [Orbilia oligospora]KAF3208703.1 hypothetical protein TWF106_011385 [Orbilia oligospora]KAF3223835.1 hypothetical protein TWF679_000270 [Orbilia oligospora]KAF3241606.1 hypothetical protein TWF192_008900 [Orbilia oligospora]
MPLQIPEGVLLRVLRAVPRKDLANLRLVSRQVNVVATQLLFEQLNISYGYNRSEAQMKGLIASGLCPLIKTVFVPSESFFRRMDRFSFSNIGKFPWSFDHPRFPCNPAHEPRTDVARAQVYWELGFYEAGALPGSLVIDNPNQFPWKVMHSREKVWRLEQDEYTYSKTLIDFFRAAVNVESVEFACGVGYLDERMDLWNSIIFHLLGELKNSRIQMIVLSVPQHQCLTKLLGETRNKSKTYPLGAGKRAPWLLFRDQYGIRCEWFPTYVFELPK